MFCYMTPKNYTSAVAEPVFRALYYLQPVKNMPLTVGGAYEFYYEPWQYTEPYPYGDVWSKVTKWHGEYFPDIVNQNDYYESIVRGDKTDNQVGHRVNVFSAYRLLPSLSLGFRYAYYIQGAEGGYELYDRWSPLRYPQPDPWREPDWSDCGAYRWEL